MCSSTTGRNCTSIEIHTWYVPKQRAHVSKFHRNAVPITGSSVEAPLFRYIYRQVLKYQGHVYQVYNICTNNAMPMHEKAVNGDGLCAGCTPCGRRRRVDPWSCPSLTIHIILYMSRYIVDSVRTNNAVPVHKKAIDCDALCAGCTPCGRRRRADPWPCPSLAIHIPLYMSRYIVNSVCTNVRATPCRCTRRRSMVRDCVPVARPVVGADASTLGHVSHLRYIY